MRNFKKVIALVLAVALMMSTFTVAFAAEKSEAQMLGELGLLLNVTSADLETELTRAVGIAMVLKALGFTQASADAYKSEAAKFTSDANEWYAGFAEFAFVSGITNGVSDKAFGGKMDLTPKMFTTWILRALGYNSADAWSKTAELAVTAGLPAVSDATVFTKSDAAKTMFAALSSTLVNTELKLIDKLITAGVVTEAAATAAGLKPAELTVSEISTLNAKQVKVVFNKTVDKAKAETVDNYDVFLAAAGSVDVFTTTTLGAGASLQADGKTVILTLNTASQFVNYSTTNKVVVKVGTGLAKEVSNAAVAISDTVVPTLLSASATGSNEITLVFSEPVTSAGAPTQIVLNDGTVGVSLGGATYSVTGYSLTFTTYANLVSGTAYTVKVSATTNIKDYAGYALTPGTAAFTFAPVTAAPTYTLKESNERTATIEFSSAIKASTLVGNTAATFTHTYNNVTNRVTGTAVTNPSGDSKTFVITFANAFPPNAATLYAAYADGTADSAKVKDAFGNIVTLVNLSVNTVADVTAPTATVALAANSNTRINVTFSEAVAGALTAGNYSLKKGTTVVAFTGPTLDTGNKYYITANAAMSGDYTLEIKNVTDTSIATNKIVTATFNVAVADLIKPFIVTEAGAAGSSYFAQTDTKTVRIYFSEAMDTASLSDLTKYQSVSAAYANPTAAVPATDAKSVLLTFEAIPGGNIIVGTVKDTAGNLVTGLSATLTPAVGAPVGLATVTTDLPNVVVADSTATVKVYLNDLVSGLTTADFEVNNGSAWVTPATFTVDNSSGKSVVTLILQDANKFVAAATGVSVRTSGGIATTGGKNAYGQFILVASTPAVDKIAPTVDKVVFVNATTIQVLFTEALTAASLATAGVNSFAVTGGTLTSALIGGVANNYIVLTGTDFTADTDVAYTGTNIIDTHSNKLAAIAHTAELSAAANQVGQAELVLATAAVVAYEALPLTTVGEVNAAVANNGTVATAAIATASAAGVTDTASLTTRVATKLAAVVIESAKITALTNAIAAKQAVLDALVVDDTGTPVVGTITTANQTAFQATLAAATTTKNAPATTIAVIVTTTTSITAATPTLN